MRTAKTLNQTGQMPRLTWRTLILLVLPCRGSHLSVNYHVQKFFNFGNHLTAVCLFVLVFYAVATVFQSYNGDQLS